MYRVYHNIYIYIHIYIYIYIYICIIITVIIIIHAYIYIYYIYKSDGVVLSAWNSLNWIKGDFGGPLKKSWGYFLSTSPLGIW